MTTSTRTEYLYGLPLRPLGPGACPATSVREVRAGLDAFSHQTRHGIAVYDSPLSLEDVVRFEFVPQLADDDLAAFTQGIAQGLLRYGDRLLGFYHGDRRSEVVQLVMARVTKVYPFGVLHDTDTLCGLVAQALQTLLEDNLEAA